MDKAVYSGTILICLVLVVGSGWFPDNAAMWLASTSVLMNIARAAVVMLMIGLLVTNPPRRLAFRALLGVAALGFLTAAMSRIYSGSIQLVDALIFLEVAISFGLAALEGQPLARPVGARLQPLQRYVQDDSLLYRRPSLAGVSDIAGALAFSRYAPSLLLSRAVFTVGILSGALYQGNHPYRSLWRGS